MKYSRERLEEFLKETNERFKSKFKSVERLQESYIEDVQGIRYSVHIYCWGMSPEQLPNLELHWENYLSNLDKSLTGNEHLVLQSEWNIIIQEPTITCPYTFDLLDTPTEGRYVFYSRWRAFRDGEALEFSDRKGEQLNKYKTNYRNWIE